MTAPLGELFAATDIDFRAGWVDTIDAGKGVISLKGVDGAAEMLPYDSLVVAAGSHGFQPPIPGFADFVHGVNDRVAAVAADKYLTDTSAPTGTPAVGTAEGGRGQDT